MSGHVSVALRIGSAEFSRCTADVFTPDTLTVTSIDDGVIVRVIPPGQWRECSVYEDRHPAFGFVSKTPCAAVLSPDALRGKAVA